MSVPALAVNMADAEYNIIRAIKSRLVTLLRGSPAIGKSALVHKIAATYGLLVIDLRLAQCDPTDLLGFPHICKDTGKASYMPMDTFPLEDDPIPEGYNGWLLFLDEMTHADRAVQKATYKLVLDRKVGNKKLHPNCAIVGAGNLDTDNAFVEELSEALKSRLAHLFLQVDNDQWLNWAAENNIDHRVVSYIRYQPRNLYKFDPNSGATTYPSPRTWEFVHRLIQNEEDIPRRMLPLLGGTIGEGTAREFWTFTQIYKELVTVEDILRSPNTAPVPREPATLYALTGSLAQHMTPDNADDLMIYVDRLPAEFKIMTMRDAVRRDQDLKRCDGVKRWLTQYAREIYG